MGDMWEEDQQAFIKLLRRVNELNCGVCCGELEIRMVPDTSSRGFFMEVNYVYGHLVSAECSSLYNFAQAINDCIDSLNSNFQLCPICQEDVWIGETYACDYCEKPVCDNCLEYVDGYGNVCSQCKPKVMKQVFGENTDIETRVDSIEAKLEQIAKVIEGKLNG